MSAFACHPGGQTGGEDILGWNLVRQIARYHDAWVITTRENQRAILAVRDSALTEHLKVHAFDVPVLWRWLPPIPGGIQCYAYLWQVGIYLLAKRLHRRYRMDCFHHVTYANDWMASVVGALLPVPFIRGPGGGAQRVPTSFLKEFSWPDRLWQRIRQVGQWLFRHDPVFLLSQRRAKAILVCNHESLNAIPARWRSKAHLFPVNGVSTEDLTALLNTSPFGASEGLRVLSVGKLLRLKGFSLALKAFAKFAERYPDGRFTIIGDGPDRQTLLRMMNELGVGARVRVEPWLERQDVFRALRESDVFLFPSLRDGGGAVVVEAMAAGKPVICLDLGGPALHVTPECGIKVPAHHPEQVVHDLADALERLCCDARLRLAMGAAAQQRAKQVYHWDGHGRRLVRIYEQIVSSQPSDGRSLTPSNNPVLVSSV